MTPRDAQRRRSEHVRQPGPGADESLEIGPLLRGKRLENAEQGAEHVLARSGRPARMGRFLGDSRVFP